MSLRNPVFPRNNLAIFHSETLRSLNRDELSFPEFRFAASVDRPARLSSQLDIFMPNLYLDVDHATAWDIYVCLYRTRAFLCRPSRKVSASAALAASVMYVVSSTRQRHEDGSNNYCSRSAVQRVITGSVTAQQRSRYRVQGDEFWPRRRGERLSQAFQFLINFFLRKISFYLFNVNFLT